MTWPACTPWATCTTCTRSAARDSAHATSTPASTTIAPPRAIHWVRTLLRTRSVVVMSTTPSRSPAAPRPIRATAPVRAGACVVERSRRQHRRVAAATAIANAAAAGVTTPTDAPTTAAALTSPMPMPRSRWTASSSPPPSVAPTSIDPDRGRTGERRRGEQCDRCTREQTIGQSSFVDVDERGQYQQHPDDGRAHSHDRGQRRCCAHHHTRHCRQHRRPTDHGRRVIPRSAEAFRRGDRTGRRDPHRVDSVHRHHSPVDYRG